MTDELLFTVHGSTATPAQPLTLAEAGLRERRDLQEWVIAHPEILGPDIMIVTMEFDRWRSSNGSTADRLDILGLHSSGELVVAELKRDKAPDTVEMQAIKYAAMVSRFTPETLAEQHAKYLTDRGTASDAEAAADALARHADLTAESLRRPRVILLASGFPQTTSATAVWLSEMGINISLVQYKAYRTGQEISISVSQLFPIPEIEDFTISPSRAEARAVEQTRKRREDVGTVAKIVSNDLLADGAQLTLRPYGVNAELREQLHAWLEQAPERSKASWHNDESRPILWAADGQSYTPTTVARMILREATGVDRAVRGGDWWVDEQGRSLVELAASAQGDRPALYVHFWALFLEHVREVRPEWAGAQHASNANWINLAGSTGGAGWVVSFAKQGRIRSELYFNDGGSGLYERLKAHRDQLEQAVGQELSWEDLPDRKASRIALYRSGDIERQEEYREYVEWFVATQQRLRSAIDALGPVVTPS